MTTDEKRMKHIHYCCLMRALDINKKQFLQSTYNARFFNQNYRLLYLLAVAKLTSLILTCESDHGHYNQSINQSTVVTTVQMYSTMHNKPRITRGKRSVAIFLLNEQRFGRQKTSPLINVTRRRYVQRQQRRRRRQMLS